MSKYLHLNKAWVESQVQLLTIKVGVTEANFTAAKDAVRQHMAKRIIPDALMEDRIQSDGQFSYQLRKAGMFGGGAVRRRWEAFYANKQKELEEFTNEAVESIFSSIKKSEFSENSAYWKIDPSGKWQPLANRPLTPTSEMSPLEAEHFVNQLLLFMGAAGAKVTQFSQDGGVDCISDHYAAQVKHLSKPVGVATVRETFAVGISKNKTPIIFSKSGFTSGAISFAIEYHVLLFTYLPLLEGNTNISKAMLNVGFGTPPGKQSEESVSYEKAFTPKKRNPKSDAAYRDYLARQRRR